LFLQTFARDHPGLFALGEIAADEFILGQRADALVYEFLAHELIPFADQFFTRGGIAGHKIGRTLTDRGRHEGADFGGVFAGVFLGAKINTIGTEAGIGEEQGAGLGAVLSDVERLVGDEALLDKFFIRHKLREAEVERDGVTFDFVVGLDLADPRRARARPVAYLSRPRSCLASTCAKACCPPTPNFDLSSQSLPRCPSGHRDRRC